MFERKVEPVCKISCETCESIFSRVGSLLSHPVEMGMWPREQVLVLPWSEAMLKAEIHLERFKEHKINLFEGVRITNGSVAITSGKPKDITNG